MPIYGTDDFLDGTTINDQQLHPQTVKEVLTPIYRAFLKVNNGKTYGYTFMKEQYEQHRDPEQDPSVAELLRMFGNWTSVVATIPVEDVLIHPKKDPQEDALEVFYQSMLLVSENLGKKFQDITVRDYNAVKASGVDIPDWKTAARRVRKKRYSWNLLKQTVLERFF